MCHSVPAQFRSFDRLEIGEPRLFVGPRPLRHETIGQSVKTYSMMQLVSVRDQFYSLGGGGLGDLVDHMVFRGNRGGISRFKQKKGDLRKLTADERGSVTSNTSPPLPR